MKKRYFTCKLYYISKTKYIDNHRTEIRNEDGTLFARDRKSNTTPMYLPPWYAYGRYYKRWGFLSTKGITDLKYIPSRFSNHFLKDDFLLICYGGKMHEKDSSKHSFIDEYGCDEYVYGSEIITVLRGARQYSKYDISGIAEQLKQKVEWLRNTYPDEFGSFTYDVDAALGEDLIPREREPEILTVEKMQGYKVNVTFRTGEERTIFVPALCNEKQLNTIMEKSWDEQIIEIICDGAFLEFSTGVWISKTKIYYSKQEDANGGNKNRDT